MSENPIYCPHCGNEQRSSANFCTNCGKPVHANSRSKETKPAPKKWLLAIGAIAVSAVIGFAVASTMTDSLATDEPKEHDYVLATDEDFKENENGQLAYIGKSDYVEIPHTINGDDVTSYDSMFQDTSVKGVKSTNPNVTNMNSMFNGNLAKSLDVSQLDTSAVTDMEYMFYETAAETIDMSTFDTSNVTDMGLMFGESTVKTLDLSQFNTPNVTTMASMFTNSKATAINVSSFNTSNVRDMYGMFYHSQAKELDLTNFDTSNVSDMSQMFDSSAAEVLDLSSFDTSNLYYDPEVGTGYDLMFDDAKATTGYAVDRSTANQFNELGSVPAQLEFIVNE